MAPSEAPILQSGDTLEGRYRIVKPLDEGGMGTIFLAEHVLIKRKVALKVLRAEYATDPDILERFMNEARAAGTLGHPNIVESTDMGFTRDGTPFIVFEFLEGSLLVDEVHRLRGLPVRRTLKIGHQIASALEAAHNAGIIHRDLKSENIFLTDKDDRPDHVKVLDFGISRFMETETDSKPGATVMGTPEFMAPEQVTSPEKVDRRADIYALGVILYEMLTARRPFRNDADPQDVLQQVIRDAPPPMRRPEVPPGLEEMILDKLLAKDPDRRYGTMKEVQGALEAFYSMVRPSASITPLSIPIPQVMLPDVAAVIATPPAPAPKPRSKAPAIVALVGALAAGVAGAGLMLAGGGRATAAAEVPAATRASLQADADQLGQLIDDHVRSAKLRAEAIAATPMLRAGIETDAATVADLASNERLFAPKPDEVIEILQLKDKQRTLLLRLPAKAAALPALDGDASRVVVAGDRLQVVTGGPITTQAGAVGGAIAFAAPVELAPIRKAVGQHALAATLVGLDAPVALASSATPGTTVEAPIALKEIHAALKLSAVVTAPPPVDKSAFGVLPYVAFGIGGLLLLFALAGLIRGTPER